MIEREREREIDIDKDCCFCWPLALLMAMKAIDKEWGLTSLQSVIYIDCSQSSSDRI